MTVLLTVLVFLLAMAIHELGHAWEMKKQGVEIAEMGIGIPIAKVPHLRLPIKLWEMDIVLTFHPMLLGAYVQPSGRGQSVMEALSDREQHLIYAGGVIANLVTWGVITAVFGLLGWMKVTIALFATGVVLLCLLARGFVSAYVLPLVGLVMVGLIIHSFVTMPITESVAGPVGVVTVIHQQIAGVDAFIAQVRSAVFMLGVISLIIGLMNTLPIAALDGGRSVFLYLKKWGMSERALMWYVVGSTALLFGLIILAFYADGVRLFSS